MQHYQQDSQPLNAQTPYAALINAQKPQQQKNRPTIDLLLEAHAKANESMRGVIGRLDDMLTRLGHVRTPQPAGTSGVAVVPNGIIGLMSEQIQGTEANAQELHRLLDSIGEYL